MDYARMSDRRLLEVIVETPGPDDSGQSDSNDDPLSCSDPDNDEGNGQEEELNENDTGSSPPKEGPGWFTRKLDYQLYQRGFLSILRNAARAVLVDIMRNYARNCHIAYKRYAGIYFKAGRHFMLSYTNKNTLWHAQQAVVLYEDVFLHGNSGRRVNSVVPTNGQRTTRHRLLALALRRSIEMHQIVLDTVGRMLERFESRQDLHIPRFAALSLQREEYSQAIATLVIRYEGHMEAGPQVTDDDPNPESQKASEDDIFKDGRLPEYKQEVVEREEEYERLWKLAVEEAERLVGPDGLPALEGPPDNMDPEEVMASFCKTVIAGYPEDIANC
ncbi:hypothetical protein D6D02_02622 [Aureobasidium pullulans]|nr:hypothetical protein D6D02_02622 [Aureobasidium pullulans]